MPYLVDGNNLAHALGFSNGAQADRESCARTVGVFCRVQGAQATVIFDGPAPAGSRGAGQTDRMRIVFSEAKSADELGVYRAVKNAVSIDGLPAFDIALA